MADVKIKITMSADRAAALSVILEKHKNDYPVDSNGYVAISEFLQQVDAA